MGNSILSFIEKKTKHRTGNLLSTLIRISDLREYPRRLHHTKSPIHHLFYFFWMQVKSDASDRYYSYILLNITLIISHSYLH